MMIIFKLFLGETMLLHVKGRRMCQIRLVEPKPSSINSGDAYIALNGTEVIGGEYFYQIN